MERLLSPCKDTCALDTSASVCNGCGRSVAEIAEWGSANAPARNRAAIFCPFGKPRFTNALRVLTPKRIQGCLHI
ncbi:hypothetical protein C8024_00070 [Sphingopyxis sp. BSNA05]|uniref:DUF1289 domain-containing protein n=1 Tax=Sphingopyxis sp. BSNA05 TaxID=1236614 RepID=UPI0015630492|nr:hypothetical protein [Sphingopyxis sp. BSNA05]